VHRRLPAVLVALAALLTACGGGGSDDAACSPEVRERLDPNSIQHLLPGAAAPTYQTHPPTSGAHQVGAWPTGVLTDTIREPVQVALLEGGEVVVQYRGRDVDAAEREEMEAFARRTARVTVAPNPDLPAPIVATAWTYKQTCTRLDSGALGRFVRAHAGKGA
jgi:uncharacterized protein DUF3105